jgi:ligand-binding sensor domain-containing protein/serine phosphatase RsbU (regulator of sigma subunit)
VKLPAKIFFSFFLFPVLFFSQVYNFRNFSIEDGLAQSQVLSITQDKFGNIIFGTNGGGVSIYDGLKFSGLNENDGLLNNVVFSVIELKNGNLAFGTNGGLSIYNGKRFFNYGEKDGFRYPRIFDLFEDENGIIWMGTEQGVVKYDPSTRKAERFMGEDSLLSNSNIFKVFRDSKKNWWFGTITAGTIKIADGKKVVYDAQHGLLDNWTRSFTEDFDGNVFIASNTGIHKVINGRPELVPLPGADVSGYTGILPVTPGIAWFAGYNGLIKLENGKTTKITSANGLISNNIWCSFKDREGNIWVGTEGYGAARFMGEYQYNFLFTKASTDENVTCVFEDKSGAMWVAVTNMGLYSISSSGAITSFRQDPNDIANSLSDNSVRAIVQEKNGDLWFGTIAGLTRYDGKKFTNYTGKNGLVDSTVLSLHLDKKGVLWIGTQNGLYKFSDGKISKDENVEKLRTEGFFTIHNIHEDNGGILWIGTDKGVIKYNHAVAERIDNSKGFIDRRVYTVADDAKGNLLLATDEGLFFYDHQHFSNVLKMLKDAIHPVYSIVIDAKENIWMGTAKGLDRFNLKSFRQHESIEILHFGKAEGLRGLECNQNAAVIDSKKRLWFGTIKGTAVFDPRYERKNEQEAILRLSAMKLFFQSFDFSPYSEKMDSVTNLPVNLQLPYDKNHITFDFIGVCQTNPNKVKYMFKLEGQDENWFDPTYKNEITYSSLQPGKYTFFLKAMNNDGVWNKEPLQFSFKVLPPWYRTWWFYTLVAIIAIAGVYAFITVRTKQLEKQKRILEEQVEERTSELREEKEKVELINKEVLSQKEIIETKNKDITDSINYAKNIQEALMPSVKLLYSSFPGAFVLYMPKDIVSGDFYWFAKRGGKDFFAAVDCTGHGVPGAFMSIIGNSLLHEIVAERNIFQPAKILDELHLGVKEALNQNKGETERRDGMDIALCAYNPGTGILEYAGANRPLWIFRAEKLENAQETTKPNKFPIGGLELEENRSFTHHEIRINKGDCAYVFTDGYADQFGGEKGKKFMLGNLQKALEQIHTSPMQEQKEFLSKTFLRWRGEHEQIDDVLVIGVKF